MWGLLPFFENASGNNNILHVSNVNDETRHNIPDEVSELSATEAHFNLQSHTHHMVTGQTAQTNQIPEFFTGRILTPRNASSHQYQNLSTQVSHKTTNYQWLNKHQEIKPQTQTIPFDCLADAIAGIATQQRPQAATMLKPLCTNTLIFDGKSESFELFEDLFHTMLKMQTEMTEAMKIGHFHAIYKKKHFKHLEKQVHQTRKLSMMS